jgi:hypothetical protein
MNHAVSGQVQHHASDIRVRQLEAEKAVMLQALSLAYSYLMDVPGESPSFNEVWNTLRGVLLVHGDASTKADDRVYRMIERVEILQMLDQMQGAVSPNAPGYHVIAQVMGVIRMRDQAIR